MAADFISCPVGPARSLDVRGMDWDCPKTRLCRESEVTSCLMPPNISLNFPWRGNSKAEAVCGRRMCRGVAAWTFFSGKSEYHPLLC